MTWLLCYLRTASDEFSKSASTVLSFGHPIFRSSSVNNIESDFVRAHRYRKFTCITLYVDTCRYKAICSCTVVGSHVQGFCRSWLILLYNCWEPSPWAIFSPNPSVSGGWEEYWFLVVCSLELMQWKIILQCCNSTKNITQLGKCSQFADFCLSQNARWQVFVRFRCKVRFDTINETHYDRCSNGPIWVTDMSQGYE